MTTLTEPMAAHLLETPYTKNEISITGKWVPTKKGGLFRPSNESKGMIQEWQNIHAEAKKHVGMLSTELNHAVGQDAMLVHHVFENEQSLASYFDNTASDHAKDLRQVAKPEIHLVRGAKISDSTVRALREKNVPVAFAQYLFGYVKHENTQPDPKKAIQVTAKWTCKPGQSIEELKYWWQMVGTDAYDMESGLVRFEVYECLEENALIIHETFDCSDELKFHLTKGTAAKYKKQIDTIAFPENYFFRGPVSWTIRTYSKFMGLPATYSSRGSHFTQLGGNASDGYSKPTSHLIKQSNHISMETNQITVVYQWIAKEGKAEVLKAIYREVEKQMKDTEPGALDVQCYFDEKSNTLIVSDVFQDAQALGFHLGVTAPAHFPSLLEIAQPGPFLFCGNVPAEMQQAALGMGLDATFAPLQFGFSRAAELA